METLLNGGIIQLTALVLLLGEALIKQYRAVTANQSAQFRASALVIIGLFAVTNYVAYVIPNYRSAEFLVFCTLALSFRHHHARGFAQSPVARHHVPADVAFNSAAAKVIHKEQRPC
jgi:hypothetical protein